MGSYVASKWIMFRGHLGYFSKPPIGGRFNTKLGDYGNLNVDNCWFVLCYHVWGAAWIGNSLKQHLVWGPGHIWLYATLEGPWPHCMIWEVSWDSCWTLSFGLPQFHGHDSWLMREVALSTYRWWSLPKKEVVIMKNLMNQSCLSKTPWYTLDDTLSIATICCNSGRENGSFWLSNGGFMATVFEQWVTKTLLYTCVMVLPFLVYFMCAIYTSLFFLDIIFLCTSLPLSKPLGLDSSLGT